MNQQNTRITSSQKLIYFFSIGGALMGVVFVCVILGVDLYSNDLAFSFQNLIVIHKLHPVLGLIEIVPIPLFIISYFIGAYLSKNAEILKQSIELERHKSKKIFNFIEKLRIGQINAEFEVVEKGDELGKSLVNLRDELKRSKEEESSRKQEDSQRHWITEGLAKFGAILRENINNLDQLAYQIISNLVKYIDAQQAGFFILDDSDKNNKYFELISFFAYGRKKFADKRIVWGEGMIGACAIEMQTIFLTEVTEKYVEITSGLGKANPRCLVIVPLKFNDVVYGVLEIASFKVYESYEIDFIEKVAESIASTISNVKINLRTAQLLKESQGQAVILARQEEEMRRNMEELKDTQIEAAKQSEQFISFTNSVNHTMIRAEYTVDGTLLYANTKFLQKLGYTANSEVEGKHISMFINKKDREWFEQLWKGLAAGGKHFEGDMKHVTKQGIDVWTMATYVSVRDHRGMPEKILFLGIDTTEAKRQSLDYKGQIDALNRSTLKAEYLPDGNILEYNKKFQDLLGFSMEELQDKLLFDFIPADEVDEFKVVWENVLNGVPYEGRMRRFTKTNEERWLHGTYTVVHDMYSEVAKIVYIATDITEQKRIEIKNKEQTEILKFQEEKLQQSKVELSRKLKETREEMKQQFREIETVKMLNEKTLEGMLDAVISINEGNKIEFFNKAAEELWGLQRDDVLGKPIDTILAAEYMNQNDNFMGNFFKSGDNTPLGSRNEVYIIDKFGEKVSVLVTLSEARIGNRFSLTAFVQKIEVELF